MGIDLVLVWSKNEAFNMQEYPFNTNLSSCLFASID